MDTTYSIKLLNDKARSLNGKAIENILRYTDINSLKEKIHNFQNMDIQNLSNKELEDNIDEVLSVKLNGGMTTSITMSEYSLFGKGSRFYRVRKLKNSDMPNRELKKLSSYWNPPRKYVKHYGRLNKPGESLLYTALNPYTAMCETNIQVGDSFVLCVYESIKSLRFSWIGGSANYGFNGIKNKKAIEVQETIRDFLVNEFTRVIPEKQESLYRITKIIANKYYTFPNDNGWRYPSIKNNFEDNICFRSECITQAIRLVGSIVATISTESDFRQKTMSVEYVVIGPNMDHYYAYQSEKGEEYTRKLFPEFFK